MTQTSKLLSPSSTSRTETKEGDIRAVIHLITSEYLGLDYSPVIAKDKGDRT